MITPQMPKIININSSDKRATSKVKRLMENLFSQIQTTGSPFVFNENELINRLNELPYICLVNKLTLLQAREIIKGIPGREVQDDDSFYEELFNRMKEAPLYDRNRSEDELERKINDKWRRNMERRETVKLPPEFEKEIDKEIYDSPPHPGELEGSDGTITISKNREGEIEIERKVIVSVVDCYGIYVSSIKKYLRKMQISPKNVKKDGPAVLLAPELIQTIPAMVFQKNRLLYEKIQYHKINPYELSLKLVLLHEIGHHVFPVKVNNYDRFLSEAMANWFAFCLISPPEREFLHELSLKQTKEYRAYNGLAFFLYPFYPCCPIPLFPWCYPRNCSSFASESLINWFEEQAFKGELGKSVKNHQSPEWLKEINKYRYDEKEFWWYFEEKYHPYWRIWRYHYHCCIENGEVLPAQLIACRLLDKAIFFDSIGKMSNFIKEIKRIRRDNNKGPLMLVSNAKQWWYNNKLWSVAR